jgi:hypothetical protein
MHVRFRILFLDTSIMLGPDEIFKIMGNLFLKEMSVNLILDNGIQLIFHVDHIEFFKNFVINFFFTFGNSLSSRAQSSSIWI